MIISTAELEKMEVSAEVQNFIAAIEANPNNFKADLGLMGRHGLDDLTTGIEGGIYFTNNKAFGFIDYTCVGGFSFMNAKEAEAVYEQIKKLLARKMDIEQQETKVRFENAYKTPQEGRG